MNKVLPMWRSYFEGRLQKQTPRNCFSDCTDRQFVFETLITSLNLSRFKTEGWVKFLIDAISHHKRAVDPMEHITASWMQNAELFESSDLVCFARCARTTMLLASVFLDRPLGKPLPRIEVSCPCDATSTRTSRKAWEVFHDATDACATKDVEVTLRCSLCHRSWTLETAHLMGVIRCIKSRYCVKIEYILSRGWVS
jgi:hypothetical protein